MIRKLWLYPPLAFARLGTSRTPCDSYHWGPNDLRPRGTGKTTVVPAETLDVAADGTVTSRLPLEMVFKDAEGIRPVCPFFELHGEWELRGEVNSGPVTPTVLGAFGLTERDLRWRVDVANLKPFHYTLQADDQVVATLELNGDVHERQPLLAGSPPDAAQPLVPPGTKLPLGSVQLTRPSDQLPEIRLRFTPGVGAVYGPTDLPQRTRTYVLPSDRLILNPSAPWCRFRLSEDPRTNPGGLFAGAEEGGISLGLADDICDGIVQCSVADAVPAAARVVVGPPTYAPDRRPFVSIADGLTDRVRRADVQDPSYLDDEALTSLEIRDLMERVQETMENVNVDVQNDRARLENTAIARAEGRSLEEAADEAFPPIEPMLGRPFPLTERGRQPHRRFVAQEAWEDLIRERPDLVSKVIRQPVTGDRYYDRRMPAVMRGSDRLPMHLTRRQYDLLVLWARRLRQKAEEGT